jgi:hypothetical protein
MRGGILILCDGVIILDLSKHKEEKKNIVTIVCLSWLPICKQRSSSISSDKSQFLDSLTCLFPWVVYATSCTELYVAMVILEGSLFS